MKKQSRFLAVALVLMLIFSLSAGVMADNLYDPNNPPVEEPVFSDIANNWAAGVIMEDWTYGLINGYTDGTFKPAAQLTRAEFAQMLYNALDLEVSADTKLPFKDVPAKYWGLDAITALYQAGIVNGTSAVEFSPNAFITRESVAVMVARADAAGFLNLNADTSKDPKTFKDYSNVSKFALDGVKTVYQAGLMNGLPGNLFGPQNLITRAECAAIIERCINYLDHEILPIRITQSDWTSYKQEVQLSNGLSMAYVEMGDPEGEVIMLIHGSTDTSRSWSLAAPYLADKYHLYIPDVRNHGATGGGDDENTMRRIENGVLGYDMKCFAEAVGVERANWVGHSRGAKIVQLVGLNFPEITSRVVTVSGSVAYQNTPGGRSMFYYEEPFDKIPINGPYFDGTTQWDNYMDYWYYNDIPVDDDFLSMAKYESSWLPLEAWRAIGGSLTEPCEFNDDIPFLAMFGAADYLSPGAVRQAGFINNYGTNVDEYVMYRGMGHNLQWEDPEKITTKIDEFIQDYPAAEVEADNDYPVGDYEAPPVAPLEEGDAGYIDPADYYDADGNLIKKLDSIPQGNWVEFKKSVDLESGIEMKYIEMGDPEGEPLVLLHGMTDSSRSWSLLVPYLSNYHLYIPDQRGHGDSGKPDMKKYDRSLFAYDLSCFMQEMGLEKANIMGHSMGSMNAQAFAMDYPEMVDHLILESTACIGTNSADPADARNIYILEDGEESPLTWDYMEWWYYNPVPVEPVFHFNAIMESWNLPLKCWASINAVPYQSRNIKCKTLVLYGGVDYLMGGTTQETVKQQFDEAGVDYTYVQFDNRGHNIHWEESELVAQDVINFLNDNTDALKDHHLAPIN